MAAMARASAGSGTAGACGRGRGGQGFGEVGEEGYRRHQEGRRVLCFETCTVPTASTSIALPFPPRLLPTPPAYLAAVACSSARPVIS